MLQKAPPEVRTHLLLNQAAVQHYPQMRAAIENFIVANRAWTPPAAMTTTGGPTPMEVDLLAGPGGPGGKGAKGKSKEGGKSGKHGKPGKGGKGKGKDAGKSGKPHHQPPDRHQHAAQPQQTFAGYCGYCGRWGHRQRDCRQKSAAVHEVTGEQVLSSTTGAATTAPSTTAGAVSVISYDAAPPEGPPGGGR